MESLQNKVRPSNFSEIIGNPVTVSVIAKQLATDTFKHAYLFVGSAGAGKTSMARIMCKLLNKDEGASAEEHSAKDLMEGNLKEYIAGLEHVALDSKYRVVILDEVQAFTKVQWDVLLKPIEQPQKHVIFILCTTEPQKLPWAIQTRCQRFDFYKVSVEELFTHLMYICNEKLKIKFEEKGLRRIAYKADGSVREAVKLLEQCVDYGDLTTENIELVLNAFSIDDLIELTRCLEKKDKARGIELLNKISSKTNIKQVFSQLTQVLLDLQKLKLTGKLVDTMFIEDPKIEVNVEWIEQLIKMREFVNEENSKLLFEHFIIGGLND